MATSLSVDPTAVQGNEKVSGEDIPSATARLSVADNNDGQQLSLEDANLEANSSESITSTTAMLRSEQARLKAELASVHQSLAEKEVELAKLDHSFHLVNMQIIECVQDLMKAKAPQLGEYSTQIDWILKYVEKQKEHNLKREVERNLWLQQEQKFKKAMDSEN